MNETNENIREFQTKDIGKIMRIWFDTNVKTHYFISKKYWLEQFDNVKLALPQSEIYVYEINNKDIVGFIGLSDDYIEGLFVDVNYQSTGIGKQLLDYIKNIKICLSLNVYEKNDRATRFYLRECFTIQSENIDNNTGENEFTMIWKSPI